MNERFSREIFRKVRVCNYLKDHCPPGHDFIDAQFLAEILIWHLEDPSLIQRDPVAKELLTERLSSLPKFSIEFMHWYQNNLLNEPEQRRWLFDHYRPDLNAPQILDAMNPGFTGDGRRSRTHRIRQEKSYLRSIEREWLDLRSQCWISKLRVPDGEVVLALAIPFEDLLDFASKCLNGLRPKPNTLGEARETGLGAALEMGLERLIRMEHKEFLKAKRRMKEGLKPAFRIVTEKCQQPV